MTSGIRLMLCRAAACVALSLLCVPTLASSGRAISAICERAAVTAAQATGVPLDVLRAISLTETGRRRDGAVQPWPWTVNMEGAGRWFDDRAAALDYVLRHKARGARSFDVGCFQLNFRWHGDAFASVEHMFDPDANALYAARFLAELHAEFGDWTRAAGAYHSRTPKYAKRYRERFARLRASLDPPAEIVVPQPALTDQAPQAPNAYPLLQAKSATTGLGSLVPLGASATTRLIDVSGQ